MKIYLDDERVPPSGWKLTKTPKETINFLKTGKVTELSLDHDLGDDSGIGTGYDVLLWIEEQVHMNGFKPPKMKVHSANSSARTKMELAIKSINKKLNESITIDVEVGDTILMGKFLNKKIVVKSISKDKHGMPIINGKSITRFRTIKNLTEQLFEMAKSDLKSIENFADSKLAPMDVEFSKHFFDRLNDKRNGKEITTNELVDFFKKLIINKEKFIKFLEKYKQIVVTQKNSAINIPFVIQVNKAIAKTIMRKKDFKTNDPKLGVESISENNMKNSNISKLKNIIKEEIQNILKEENEADIISMDVPLLIRLLEYAREDAKSDMDLHNVADNMIKLQNETLTMKHYNQLVGASE